MSGDGRAAAFITHAARRHDARAHSFKSYIFTTNRSSGFFLRRRRRRFRTPAFRGRRRLRHAAAARRGFRAPFRRHAELLLGTMMMPYDASQT